MSYRGNDRDVTSLINTTDPEAVNKEIDRIYLDLYPTASTWQLDLAFGDLTRLYRGEFPGYHACDTAYHNFQHVLDVTLATARLIDGYERTHVGTPSFGDPLFRLGVIIALFHDVGYLRKLKDHTHKNGAEYTLTHVSRGSHFIKDYLPQIGMAHMADIAANLIHFTGYEKSVAKIEVPSLIYRLLGSMLGTADIIAQMADRCYLEKCHDRLYPEFVAGGIAVKRTPEGKQQVMYASAEDLLKKTPGFFAGVSKRLNVDLGGCYAYMQEHFGEKKNVYLEEVYKNIQFVNRMSEHGENLMLRRNPPQTLTQEAAHEDG